MKAIFHEKLNNKGHIITTAISATSQRSILLRYVFCFIILILIFFDNYAGLRDGVTCKVTLATRIICNSYYWDIHLGVCYFCLVFCCGNPSGFQPSKNKTFKLACAYTKMQYTMCLLSPIFFVCKDITFFQNRKNNVMKIIIFIEIGCGSA